MVLCIGEDLNNIKSTFPSKCKYNFTCLFNGRPVCLRTILGDPGADSGDEGKCKQAEKYGRKEK